MEWFPAGETLAEVKKDGLGGAGISGGADFDYCHAHGREKK